MARYRRDVSDNPAIEAGTTGTAPDVTADPQSVLAAARKELQSRADTLRSGANLPSGGISFGKRVGEGTSIAIERFADVAVHDQILQQLAAVDAALVLVELGQYGRCTSCGGAIPTERLEAIPWALTCVAC